MPPMEDPQYFPPLERCLKGEHLLLSWQEVYSSLCFPRNASSPGIQKFFADPVTQDILKKPFAPFEPQQSSQFATITAAINVAPDENGPYDIKQIKGDALWLAEAVHMDKVAALRIVVLEWQKRSAVQMLSRPLNDENSQVSDNSLDVSIFAQKSSVVAPKGLEDQTLDPTYNRQLRLIRLSISESSYVLAINELKFRQFAISKAAPKEQMPAVEIDEAGKAVFEAAAPSGDVSMAIKESVDALRKSLDFLGINGEHPVTKNKTLEKFWEHLEGFWLKAHMMRVINSLQYVVTVVDSSTQIPTADAVLSYFELMQEHDFFALIDDSPHASLGGLGRKLHNITQLASLAVLSLDTALSPVDIKLVGTNKPLYPDLDPGAVRSDYLQDTSCIRRLHAIFEDMASKGAPTAALSMFAWSCIYLSLGEVAERSRRDSTDSINSEPVPPVQPSSIQKRREAFRQFLEAIHKETVQSFQGLEQGHPERGESFTLILRCTVDQLKVFSQITDVASSLRSDFGAGINETFEIRCRHALFTLISAGIPLVIYGEETLGALLSVIGGDRPYWELADRDLGLFDPVTQAFIEDDAMLGDRFLIESLARYPEEAGPYYRILRTLFLNGKLDVDSILRLLQHLNRADRFTKRLPQNFNAYDEAGDIATEMDDVLPQRLLTDLPYFISRKTGISSQRLAITNGESSARSSHGDNCVPVHSVGIPADESAKPIVMAWDHNFSPLFYMTGCLHTVLAGNDWVDASTGKEVPLEEISEIINLLSVVIMAIHKAGANESDTQDSVAVILDNPFIEADPRNNLLAYVAEIFETQLQYQQAKPGDAVSLDVLAQCIRFFHAVAVCLPSRIWPILSRSKLLELDGNGGSLAAIVTSVEMITGQYDFLIGCIRLYDALVEASLRPGGSDVQRASRALTRLNSRQTGGDPLPQRMATTIMTSFSRTLISVFANSRSWRYSHPPDKAEISTRLSRTFDRLLHYSFGFDDETDLHKKAVTSILADSATYLTDLLLSTSPSHHLAEPLVDMLFESLVGISSQQFLEAELWPLNQVKAALELSTTSLRIGMSRDAPSSCLEQALFKAAPILARLYTVHEGAKSPVAALLGNLVASAVRGQSEPPSLLGYMGPATAQDFLSVLGDFGRPINNVATEIEIWRMLSAVVSSRQQWFAISLLTGSSPTQRPKKAAGTATKKSYSKPVLAYALNELSNISTIPATHALAMLEFVALCQNYWAWAVGEMRKHPTFVSGLTSYVRSLKREDGDAPLRTCNETAIAASIAEVLAMYLHAAAQVGDADAIKNVSPHLQYFRKYGVAAPKYNSSLHFNLQKNLEERYGGLQPGNFKHTNIFATEFGSNYFYDVAFEAKVLGLRRSTNKMALQSLQEEFRLANIDLSTVEAQIRLLKQWKLLATQLSKATGENGDLTDLLISVVKQCLHENANSNVPERFFQRLRDHRVDLIMVLLQKLVSVDIKDHERDAELRSLLPAAWQTIRNFVGDQDFDSSFSGGDVEYYRALLQILFLTLQPLRKRSPPPPRQSQNARPGTSIHAPKESQQLLEVVLHVIIKGFRSLSSILHENPSACHPNDFVLLTALLQTILAIPGIELLHSQIALQFANNNITSYASSLFSWSDQFSLDGDPIYGELAILFLLEMSSVSLIAEGMAVDGILSHLTSAKIMKYFARPKGMDPFDSPTRLHSIWTRGILPLCLNLLDAVGAPIAAEVVSFLNHFPSQLDRLARNLANRHAAVGTKPADAHMTLAIASETHSLALISLVVSRYAAAGAATGSLMQDIPALKWERAGVREDVDDWVNGRGSLGAFVLPGNEREAALSRAGKLEERVWGELQAAAECLGAEG